MRSLGAPVREHESCGHNTQNEVDEHLNNSHRMPFDDGGCQGERHGMLLVLPSGKYSAGRTFGWGEDAKVDQKATCVSERQRR